MKRVLLFIALVSVIACAFIISISAEAPEMYIEFGARFEGSDQYITVYTENAENSGNPRIDLNRKFYSDADFTTEVNLSEATGLDFSVAVAHNGSSTSAVTRMTKPSTPFTKCEEIKWFTSNFESAESVMFKGFTALKSFDFGCMTSINNNCFEDTGFVNLVIPSSITGMYNGAFSSCQELSSVKFEGDVTSLGSSIFQKCPKLASVDFGSQSKTGTSMFKESGLTSVTIPKTMTSIGNSTFENCKSITSIVFEEGFSGTFGSTAFAGTKGLTSLTLVEGITEIPYQCFYGSRVPSVVLPNSVKSLAGRAFSENSSLTTLTISENSQLETIADSFNGTYITSIYLPTGVKITASPFTQCHKLEHIYNLENAVIAIKVDGVEQNILPNSFFNECRALKEIKIPNGITSIGSGVFNRCGGDNLTVIYIPSTVTKIDKGAFPKSSDWLSPKNAVIFYCGGDASKLLSLTDDGSGNVSAFIKEKVDSGKTAAYNGLNTEYAQGVIVENANTCDVYFDSIHLEDTNPCVIMCTRCGMCEQDPNAVHDFEKSVYSYANGYGKDGTISTKCKTENCMYNAEPKKETIPALIACCLGYSVPENGGGRMVVGFKANTDAINAYTENTGKTIEFGAFAIAQKNLTGDVLNADGSAAAGAIKAEMSHVGSFELIISGFKTEAQKSAMLAIGAYVISTKDNERTISYIQYGTPTENQAYEFISYNDII